MFDLPASVSILLIQKESITTHSLKKNYSASFLFLWWPGNPGVGFRTPGTRGPDSSVLLYVLGIEAGCSDGVLNC